MGSHKAFDAKRIAQSLVIIDTWRASALPLRAFATQHHHKYDQLRAWLRHEPRWRGVTQPRHATVVTAAAAPDVRSGAFQRMHPMPQLAHQGKPHPISPSAIRIECTNAANARSASVHFHGNDPSLSAQWLAAYLGT